MTTLRNRGTFFEIPHATVFVLVTVNLAAFALCVNQSGGPNIASTVLFQNGAMHSLALQRHEYWRLVAYGFLHLNLFHLATNMLCLALWGGPLERRIGPAYFLLVYAAALVVAALVSDFAHHGAYSTVGASGAVSGVLGALFGLWILGKIDLTANFFIVNVGLNAVLAFSSSRIDWAAHVGGFVAGLVASALIDLLEKLNFHLLRCKFPEFVKVNGLLIGGVLTICLAAARPTISFPFLPQESSLMLVGLILWLALIKSIDFILSIKKGLAIIVAALSVANAAFVPLLAGVFSPELNATCGSGRWASEVETLMAGACAYPNVTVYVGAACILALTIFVYSPQLSRGLKDVGFVGASLRAERRRRYGI